MLLFALFLAVAPPPSCTFGADDCRPRCDGGELESCYMLARMMNDGRSVPKDVPGAVALFQRGCDKGNGDSCNAVGVGYREGTRVPLDHAKALEFLSKACDLGSAKGCLSAGALLHFQGNFKHDVARAIPFYEQACASDDPDGVGACANLGKIYAEGHGGIPIDRVQSAREYARGCNKGDRQECALAQQQDPHVDATVTVDGELGKLKQSCDRGSARDCHGLGVAYSLGRGVPKDMPKAVSLFRNACDGGSTDGCRDAGYKLLKGDGVPVDLAGAASAFRRACELHYQVGCFEYAERLRNAEGVDRDGKKALATDVDACPTVPAACTAAGRMLIDGSGGRQDAQSGRVLLQAGCEHGDKHACADLSGAGALSTAADTKALADTQRYCRNGEGSNCEALARRYENGSGVKVDLAEAVRLYAIACASGRATACASREHLEASLTKAP